MRTLRPAGLTGGAIRRAYIQRSLVEVLLPDGDKLWDPTLRRIDAILDDDDLIDCIAEALARRHPRSRCRGRLGTPAAVVLRLLVLKHLSDWSFDECEREVRGSLVYRAFCRIDGERGPDAKTLIRLAHLLDEAVLKDVLARLVVLGRAQHLIRGRRLRVDTTVVETNIHHPTDSTLLADGVRVLTRTLRRLGAPVRRLFKPGTLEVDTDASTGMLRMLPWYPSDQVDDWRRGPLILFHLGNQGGALEVQLKAGASGYTLRSLGPRGMITVSARGGRGVERLTLHHPGTGEPRVALRNDRGAAEYDVQFVQVIHPRERLHVLRAARLRVPDGETAELAIGDRSQALVVQSRVAALGYDLELRAVTRRGEEILSRSAVGQEAGTTRVVRPRDWLDLKSRDVFYQSLPPRSSPGIREQGGRP